MKNKGKGKGSKHKRTRNRSQTFPKTKSHNSNENISTESRHNVTLDDKLENSRTIDEHVTQRQPKSSLRRITECEDTSVSPKIIKDLKGDIVSKGDPIDKSLHSELEKSDDLLPSISNVESDDNQSLSPKEPLNLSQHLINQDEPLDLTEHLKKFNRKYRYFEINTGALGPNENKKVPIVQRTKSCALSSQRYLPEVSRSLSMPSKVSANENSIRTSCEGVDNDSYIHQESEQQVEVIDYSLKALSLTNKITSRYPIEDNGLHINPPNSIKRSVCLTSASNKYDDDGPSAQNEATDYSLKSKTDSRKNFQKTKIDDGNCSTNNEGTSRFSSGKMTERLGCITNNQTTLSTVIKNKLVDQCEIQKITNLTTKNNLSMKCINNKKETNILLNRSEPEFNNMRKTSDKDILMPPANNRGTSNNDLSKDRHISEIKNFKMSSKIPKERLNSKEKNQNNLDSRKLANQSVKELAISDQTYKKNKPTNTNERIGDKYIKDDNIEGNIALIGENVGNISLTSNNFRDKTHNQNHIKNTQHIFHCNEPTHDSENTPEIHKNENVKAKFICYKDIVNDPVIHKAITDQILDEIKQNIALTHTKSPENTVSTHSENIFIPRSSQENYHAGTSINRNEVLVTDTPAEEAEALMLINKLKNNTVEHKESAELKIESFFSTEIKRQEKSPSKSPSNIKSSVESCETKDWVPISCYEENVIGNRICSHNDITDDRKDMVELSSKMSLLSTPNTKDLPPNQKSSTKRNNSRTTKKWIKNKSICKSNEQSTNRENDQPRQPNPNREENLNKSPKDDMDNIEITKFTKKEIFSEEFRTEVKDGRRRVVKTTFKVRTVLVPEKCTKNSLDENNRVGNKSDKTARKPSKPSNVKKLLNDSIQNGCRTFETISEVIDIKEIEDRFITCKRLLNIRRLVMVRKDETLCASSEAYFALVARLVDQCKKYVAEYDALKKIPNRTAAILDRMKSLLFLVGTTCGTIYENLPKLEKETNLIPAMDTNITTVLDGLEEATKEFLGKFN